MPDLILDMWYREMSPDGVQIKFPEAHVRERGYVPVSEVQHLRQKLDEIARILRNEGVALVSDPEVNKDRP